MRETKAPPGGRVGLCADTCISCLWVFVDLQSGTRRCWCLCVSVALRGCFAPVSTFAGLRLAVGVGGRIACVRIRGRCLPTCLGWVSTEGVRAESPTPPHLPAPPLSTRAHDFAPNFSPGSSATAPVLPTAARPGAPAALPLSFLRSQDRKGLRWDWWSGGSAAPGDWPGRGWEERADSPADPGWEEEARGGSRAPVLGWGEEGTGRWRCSPRASWKECDPESCVCLVGRQAPL